MGGPLQPLVRLRFQMESQCLLGLLASYSTQSFVQPLNQLRLCS